MSDEQPVFDMEVTSFEIAVLAVKERPVRVGVFRARSRTSRPLSTDVVSAGESLAFSPQAFEGPFRVRVWSEGATYDIRCGWVE